MIPLLGPICTAPVVWLALDYFFATPLTASELKQVDVILWLSTCFYCVWALAVLVRLVRRARRAGSGIV